MIENVKKSFLTLDFFGKSTTLLFKNDTYYKTNLGFFCSIVLIVLSILGGTYFLTALLNHLNPLISFSQIQDSSPLIFDNQKFYLAFAFKNQNCSNLELQLEVSSEEIPLKSLNISQNSSCGTIQNKGQTLFCLELSEIIQDQGSNSIKISVFSNNTRKKNCASDFTFFYEDFLINNIDYDSPIQKVTRTIELHTIKSFTKALQFVFEKLEVNTDMGILLQDNVVIPLLRVKNYPNELILDDSESFFAINLEKSSTELYVTRNYMKIYTVLANLGGFMKMLWLMIFVLINPLITLLYKKSLINEIFNFNDKEYYFQDDKIPPRKRPSRVNEAILKLKTFVHLFKSDKGNSKNSTKSLKKAQKETNIDSPTKEIINDVFKVKETSLDISILESLMYYVCNYKTLRMKKELIERGSKAINKRIDITYIIQKIVEIEKLKVLLLDADQLKLFEYLPKPILTNKKNEKLFSKKIFLNKVQANRNLINSNYFHEKWKQLDEDNTTNNILEKITTLFDSYQRIKSKEFITEIDQKLLDMLDENIKNLLEKTAKSPQLKKFITGNYSKSHRMKNFKMLLSLFTNPLPDKPQSNESIKYEKAEKQNKKMTNSNDISSQNILFNRATTQKIDLERAITGNSNQMIVFMSDGENNSKTNNIFIKDFSSSLKSSNENRKTQSENIQKVANNSRKENIKKQEEGKKEIKQLEFNDIKEIQEEELKDNEKPAISSKRPGDIRREVLRLNSKFKFLGKSEDENESVDNIKNSI